MFRDNLDAEIWECRNGHGFCGDCVDKDNAGGREDELEMGEDGIFRWYFVTECHIKGGLLSCLVKDATQCNAVAILA